MPVMTASILPMYLHSLGNERGQPRVGARCVVGAWCHSTVISVVAVALSPVADCSTVKASV